MTSGNHLKEIVRRRKREDGRVVRELDCGHEQLEGTGGSAPYAQLAKCKACETLKSSGPVLGACSAFVMCVRRSSASRCGKPARYEKRGEPRCAFHFNRGAR